MLRIVASWADMLVCETYNLQVAGWNLRRYQFFLLIRGLFQILLIAPYRATFCPVLASVCVAKLRLCV